MVSLKIKKCQLQNLGDYWLSFTALIQSLLMLFQSLIADSGLVTQEMSSFLRVILSVFMVGVAMLWILIRNLEKTLIIYIITLFLFVVSILLNENNMEYIFQEGLRFTLAICIPIFLSVISVKNMQIFFRACLIISFISASVGIIYAFLFATGNLPMLEDMYNMSFGYSLLLPTLFLIYFNKSKILIFLLILTILLAGSRGPLIPIFILISFKVFSLYSKAKVFGIFLLFSVSFVVLFPILLNYLSDAGINSRTLFLFLDGSIDSDSGRENIYFIVWDKVIERPLLGYGFFADRTFLGVYCHNIFLELFLNWGVFFPATLLIILILFVLYLYRKISKDEKAFSILLFSASVIPLLVSSSYLIDFRLPLLMGFVYVYAKKYILLKM